MSLFELLIIIYAEYGLYKERLIYVVRKGVDGAEEIRNMMLTFRENPPDNIAGSKVVKINDYQLSHSTDLITGKKVFIDMEKSNVLQFFLEDGSKISVRPSGTEPKIKFYFSVKSKLENTGDFEIKEAELEERIDKIIKDLKL